MIALAVGDMATVLGARVLGDPELVVSGSVETDSRLITGGSIFVALRGETTDGHRFASAAVEAGAALVIAERELELPVPVLVVDDAVTALSDLAREVVARVRALGRLSVIAVTGSNGKTTTKNLLNAVLEKEGPTIAPPGSFNNHVGAPHSMLRVDEDTAYLVVEMGASAEGEIARLVSIVMPDVAIVLKVGMAHAGVFGGIEATARAKSEIVRELPETAVAVLNMDDPRVAAMTDATHARVVGFGLGAHAAVGAGLRAEDVRMSLSGTSFDLVVEEDRFPVHLQILGEHHVYNALAAITAVRELGIPLDRSIAALETVPRAERWRMERFETPQGITVINDAYNASPDSMAAALRTLAQLAGDTGRRSVAILGEMAELGEYAEDEHDRIGRLAVRLDIKKLVVVGSGARHIHLAAGLEGSWDGESVLIATTDEAFAYLQDELRPSDVVLIKSSKSAQLRFLGDRLAGVTG